LLPQVLARPSARSYWHSTGEYRADNRATEHRAHKAQGMIALKSTDHREHRGAQSYYEKVLTGHTKGTEHRAIQGTEHRAI
jgi:hypothetical protein